MFQKALRAVSGRSRSAFTLIELLIVVAIIAVLAAIAAPNFLEAQMRAKVSRCAADMRSVGVALEAYHVDWNDYPHFYWWSGPPSLGDLKGTAEQNYGELAVLTTPVSYITVVPLDIFHFADAVRWPYDYTNTAEGWRRMGIQHPAPTMWSLRSFGPDFDRDPMLYYDATNGTVSDGDIVLTNRGFKGSLR